MVKGCLRVPNGWTVLTDMPRCVESGRLHGYEQAKRVYKVEILRTSTRSVELATILTEALRYSALVLPYCKLAAHIPCLSII